MSSILAFRREALPTLRYFPNDTELALGMTLLELPYVLQVFCVQINSDQSAALFHCLLLYPRSPLYHHVYSAVCSKAILGAFHYRIIFRKLSESARDYNHHQLVYGVQECYWSIVVQYGNVFILVDEDYFRHQQFLVAVIFPYQYLVY